MALADSLLILSLLGGLLTLEATAVGQFMLSRPIVAGTLAGWVLGMPEEGFALGALLEVYLLVAFPVGGARFPEGAPATVAAVASLVPGSPGAMALAVAVALVWGQLAGLTTTAQRTLNSRFVAPLHSSSDARRVVRTHLLAILLEFGRGCVVTGAGVVVGRLVTRLGPYWPLDATSTRGLLLLGGLVSLGVLLRSLGGLRRRAGVVGGGLAVGILMGYLL